MYNLCSVFMEQPGSIHGRDKIVLFSIVPTPALGAHQVSYPTESRSNFPSGKDAIE